MQIKKKHLLLTLLVIAASGIYYAIAERAMIKIILGPAGKDQKLENQALVEQDLCVETDEGEYVFISCNDFF